MASTALWTTQYFTPIKIRMLLAKQYLIPTLLYGCELFSNCDFLYKRKLNVTYNNIDHVSEYAKQFFNMSFDNLLNFRTVTLLQKIISEEGPIYLHDTIVLMRSSRLKQIIIKNISTFYTKGNFLISQSVFEILYLSILD